MASIFKLLSGLVPSGADVVAAAAVEVAGDAFKKVGAETVPKIVKDAIPSIVQCRGDIQDIMYDIAQRSPAVGRAWNEWFADMLGRLDPATGTVVRGVNPLTGQPYSPMAENRAVNALSMLLQSYGKERREEFRQFLKDLAMADPVRREIVIEQLTDDRLHRRIQAVGESVLTPVNDSLEQLTHTIATRRPSWLRR